jgi:hypothetical protein
MPAKTDNQAPTKDDDAAAAAALQAAADKQAQEDAAAAAAAAEKAPEAPAADKEYVACFGGPLTDPESKVCYINVPRFGPMTNWLASQIEHGKIREEATSLPA